MKTLSQYLKKDKTSGSLLYSIPKKDLDSIDFTTFPVDLSSDLSKKLAINNGVGAVAISNDNIPIVFVDATITDIAKALKNKTSKLQISQATNCLLFLIKMVDILKQYYKTIHIILYIISIRTLLCFLIL